MKDKRIMIFGGTGSLGKALIKRLSPRHHVAVFSRDEAKHWTIRNETKDPSLKFYVGDVRDKKRVIEALDSFKPETVITAAALKQVDTCELSPFESVQTNVLGVKNVLDACIERSNHWVTPTTVMLISTDKACAPVNVYGMCKALSERLVTSAGAPSVTGGAQPQQRYIAVRYGNVLESRGSIIPLFKYQAEHADEFTVTHPDMTRFVMTLDNSVDLIEAAADNAKTGEVWIPKLAAMRISDLASIFSKRYNKPVKYIGLRPGEKLHEALICSAESVRAKDTGERYVLAPAYADVPADAKMFDYTSADDVMSYEKLESYLQDLGILDRSLGSFEGKNIEEIRT